MPYIETVDELAESIADRFGVYQDCTCGCQEDEFAFHHDECLCRFCFTGDLRLRIRAAVENEKKLPKL